MSSQKRNFAASVHQRLVSLSRKNGEDFNLILVRYGIERLLYRLSQSKYTDRFLLKGAMLFLVWSGEIYRPTRDVDLLGFGSSDAGELEQIFREICLIEFYGRTLVDAIEAKFNRRKTNLPTTVPEVFTRGFALAKQIQWEAFIRRNDLSGEPFNAVVEPI
jgi:Nucleotidyl transferase AbiEii toxin, Type IV TA system